MIRISTIGDLIENAFGLNAYCEGCCLLGDESSVQAMAQSFFKELGREMG